MSEQYTNPEVEMTVDEIKSEIRKIGGRTRELILNLGNKLELERIIKKQDDICEHIKTILADEIRDDIISNRTIERYCKDEWKKKTKPKKQELKKDKLSFLERVKKTERIVIDNEGRVMRSDSRMLDLENNINSTSNYDSKNEVPLVEHTPSDSEDDSIQVEIPFEFRQLDSYMAQEFQKHNGTREVWVYAIISKSSGRILYTGTGRIGK